MSGGKNPYLFELDALGLHWIGEVPGNFPCWPTLPKYHSLQAPFASKRADTPFPLMANSDGRTSPRQGCAYAQNPGLHEYLDPPGFCSALDGGRPGRKDAPPSRGREGHAGWVPGERKEFSGGVADWTLRSN
jgi:hypothetical protein